MNEPQSPKAEAEKLLLADELKALAEERARNGAMITKGYIVAPHGGWIHRRSWSAFIRELKARAERNPQWAP